MGVGDTVAWKIGAMNNTLTLGVFFEIANQNQPIPQGQRANIQFITYYQASGASVVVVAL